MSNAEWAGHNQTKEEQGFQNHPQHVPNKDLCNLLLARWCNSFSFTFLLETSKNKAEKKNTLKTDFQVNGLQAVKDKYSRNKWSEPDECSTSPPWENFQATKQEEGTEVESTSLPELGDEGEWLRKPSQVEITGWNTGMEGVEQKKNPADLQMVFSWVMNSKHMEITGDLGKKHIWKE